MPARVFRSRRVVTADGVRPAAVLAEHGRITAIEDFTTGGADLVDVGDHVLLPGLVDAHTHINEPGRTAWEGFFTATQAAAAGGYTTLVDMPLNCLPPTTTLLALEQKRAAACSQCWVDVGFWGGVVADNQDDIEALAAAGVLGFKSFLVDPGIDGFTMVSRAQLEAALPHLARTGLPLLVHAEVGGPIEDALAQLKSNATTDWRRYSSWLSSRPDEAEVAAIHLMIELARQYGCRVHIVHLSSTKALADLRAAREHGLPITVETCPHYLYFSAERIPDGSTLHKCAPPIRSEENRERLWGALDDGVIDFVATDHSPCPPEMKSLERGDFLAAWGGVASLSVSLAVVWTEARRRGVSIERVVEWMAARPALLAGIEHRKGAIAPGRDADFVVFDPDAAFAVEEKHLRYRHPISPYVGETLDGVVEATYLRGSKVYERGVFCGEPRGEECRRA